jgi:hypothetical protein
MMLLLLLAAPAFASTPQYRISSQVISEGKIIASPRVVVNEGKLAEIADGDALKISVTPSAQAEKILLKYSIRYHSRSINAESSREILAKPGQENIFNVADSSGMRRLLVKVSAEQISPAK